LRTALRELSNGTEINKMKLLLTGASGFIGKNFLELAPKDIQIVGIYNSSRDIQNFVSEKGLNNVKLYKCDLTDKNETEKLFKKIGENFEYCIFLAGNVNVPLSKADPKKDFEITVGSLINTLQNCKFGRFIYMSTAGVYDGIKGEVDVNTKLAPVVPYCVSKLKAEENVKLYATKGNIKEYVILRFGGAFGKYSKKSKFMAKLVEDIYVNDKKCIEIYGDGTNMINVMYAKDVVKALLTALKSAKSDLICNLALKNMTITETVNRVAKIFGKEVEIKYIPKIESQKYITFTYESDFDGVFNFEPDYSFDKGIEEFGEILKNES